jgi:hypothetical protein
MRPVGREPVHDRGPMRRGNGAGQPVILKCLE